MAMTKLRFMRVTDQQDEDQQDDDAPLARDLWFAQQLGEEWREEEPGIYRHVDRKSPAG